MKSNFELASHTKKHGNGVAFDSPTIGTDPEMFVFKRGKLLPAFEFLPEKTAPVEADYTQAYWDGFQAEFRLKDSYACLMELSRAVQDGLKAVKGAANGGSLSLNSVVRVPLPLLRDSLDPHVALGCEPSKNAYGMAGKAVANPRTLKYRFAGGHMHFGQCHYTDAEYPKLVKVLDAVLGVWSVGAAKCFDNPIRRKYYGLPGEYRTPKYPSGFMGLEYRVLSNFYLCHPVAFQLAWEIGRAAWKLGHLPYANLWASEQEEVIEAIHACDAKMASFILKRNEAMFKWMFGLRGWSDDAIQRAFNVGLNGIESEVKKPEEIEENWFLDGPRLDPFDETNSRYTWRGHCAVWHD